MWCSKLQWATSRRFLLNQQSLHQQRSLSTQNCRYNNMGVHNNKRVYSNNLTEKTVYNQIDYILCSMKIKLTLINARRFSRTKSSSNHHLVVCKLQVKKYVIFKNVNKTHSKSYNTSKLIKSQETKNAYQHQLHKNFCKMECISLENILASITDAATKTIGFTKNNKNHRKPSCRTFINN